MQLFIKSGGCIFYDGVYFSYCKRSQAVKFSQNGRFLVSLHDVGLLNYFSCFRPPLPKPYGLFLMSCAGHVIATSNFLPNYPYDLQKPGKLF